MLSGAVEGDGSRAIDWKPQGSHWEASGKPLGNQQEATGATGKPLEACEKPLGSQQEATGQLLQDSAFENSGKREANHNCLQPMLCTSYVFRKYALLILILTRLPLHAIHPSGRGQ